MSASNPRIQRLREAGYRLTQARLTVLKVLETERGHITSATVLDKVERLRPGVGRASVFRALDLFTQLGIIRPTFMETSLTPTYVLMHGDHHHHVVCTDCKRFIEFADCGLDALKESLERSLDMRISGHLLEFFGICADCETEPKAGKRA